MLAKRAIVVTLPEDLIIELDNFNLVHCFDYVGYDGVPRDKDGMSIGDYFHRYIVFKLAVITGAVYWRPFEKMTSVFAYEKMNAILDDSLFPVERLYPYLTTIGPLFSVYFIDLKTVIIREENDYVTWPRHHSEEGIRNHPDIDTASCYSQFYHGPLNFYLNGVP